jgi:hypothetical protein
MNEPERPNNVPREAVWSSQENEWQLGKTVTKGSKRKQQCPVGEWRYWRADGSLCCVANFDGEGFQDGLLERFHNDGTLASRGFWKRGSRFGHFVFVRSENPTEESYPSNEETWRYEFDSEANWEEENMRWFLKDGTECTSDGRPLDSAYDLDTIIGAAEPDDYLDKYAEKIADALDPDRQKVAGEDLLQLRELWGVSAPEIDKFIQTASREASTFNLTTDRRMFEESNLWESLICHCWQNESEEIGSMFMGAVKIGGFGDSDYIYATILRPLKEEPQPNAVYYWSHDTYHIDDVLALTLDDFAFRLAVSDAVERERLSPAAARAAWQKLVGRCARHWACTDGMETVGEEVFCENLDPKNSIRGLFWRAQWIVELLKEDERRNWDDVRNCFYANWNKVLEEEQFSKLLTTGERLATTAVYLLWRFFWFNQTERLKLCCSTYKNHSARVVRDLVSLIEEIENGRVEIGRAISNIHEVREKFLALDLAPERALERTAEKGACAAAEAERAASIARGLNSELDGADEERKLALILDRAWASVKDQVTMSELEKKARELPGYELQWKSFDFIRDRGFIRDGSIVENEAEGIGYWLGQNRSEILQPFIWSTIYSDGPRMLGLLPLIGKTKGALDERLGRWCLDELGNVEEYHHKREAAVQLLTLMECDAVLPRLIDIIAEFEKEISTKAGYDIGLATIPWDDFLCTIARTFTSFGNFVESDASLSVAPDTVRGALRRLLDFSLGNHNAKIASSAIIALSVWGETNLLEAVERLLRFNDDEAQIAAFRTLEIMFSEPSNKIARKELPPQEKTRTFLVLCFRNPSEDDNAVTLMYHRAALALQERFPDLIEADSISDAMEFARDLSNYGEDRWLNWRILECETIERFSELEVGSIAPYLRSANVKLRDAAIAAYTTRGITPPTYQPVSWPVIWKTIKEQDRNEDNKAVSKLMESHIAIDLSAPAGWCWGNPGEYTAAVLSRIVSERLDSFTPLQPGEYLPSEVTWLVRALVRHEKFDGTEPVIERCLKFKDENVVYAVEAEKQLTL